MGDYHSPTGNPSDPTSIFLGTDFEHRSSDFKSLRLWMRIFLWMMFCSIPELQFFCSARTEFMVIDMDGQVIRPVTTLAFNFQLPFADDVILKDGKIVAYVSRIRRVVWCQDCMAQDGDGSKPSTRCTTHIYTLFHYCIWICWQYLGDFRGMNIHIYQLYPSILIFAKGIPWGFHGPPGGSSCFRARHQGRHWRRVGKPIAGTLWTLRWRLWNAQWMLGWMRHVDMSLGNLEDLENYLYSKWLGSTEVQHWREECNLW